MTDENMKTFRQDNFKEVVIPDDLQDLLKWTEVDQRIVDTMKAIVTQYAAQVDAAVLDECSKVAMKFGIAVDEERLVQALTDAQKFYCEGYRAGKLDAGPKWISVKDKLPEEDTLVLCVGAKGGMFLGYPRFVYKDDDYAYTRVPNARGSRHATHWMPLPEPPKEG